MVRAHNRKQFSARRWRRCAAVWCCCHWSWGKCPPSPSLFHNLPPSSQNGGIKEPYQEIDRPPFLSNPRPNRHHPFRSSSFHFPLSEHNYAILKILLYFQTGFEMRSRGRISRFELTPDMCGGLLDNGRSLGFSLPLCTYFLLFLFIYYTFAIIRGSQKCNIFSANCFVNCFSSSTVHLFWYMILQYSGMVDGKCRFL